MPGLVVAVSLFVYAVVRTYMFGGEGGETPGWLRWLLAGWHALVLPIGYLGGLTEHGGVIAAVSVLVVALTLASAVRTRRHREHRHRLAELGQATLQRPKYPGHWRLQNDVDLDELERMLGGEDLERPRPLAPSPHHPTA